jgi:hypothetical protein
VTGHSFLSGVDHLRQPIVRSTFIQYDNNLDGKHEALPVPGENYLLAGNFAVFGFSDERPSAQSIFDLIDRLVDDKTLDEADTTDASPDVFDIIDKLVHTDMLNDDNTSGKESNAFDDTDSAYYGKVEELPRLSVFFNTTSRTMVTFVALGQMLYPSISNTVSYIDTDGNVSDTSDHEYNYTEIPKLIYFAAHDQQSVAYTAFNQLLQ